MRLPCDKADTDGDGFLDCEEECPLDPNKTTPGICGCGESDEDTDGDLVPNCLDQCPNNGQMFFPGPCGCSPCDPSSGGFVNTTITDFTFVYETTPSKFSPIKRGSDGKPKTYVIHDPDLLRGIMEQKLGVELTNRIFDTFSDYDGDIEIISEFTDEGRKTTVKDADTGEKLAEYDKDGNVICEGDCKQDDDDDDDGDDNDGDSDGGGDGGEGDGGGGSEANCAAGRASIIAAQENYSRDNAYYSVAQHNRRESIVYNAGSTHRIENGVFKTGAFVNLNDGEGNEIWRKSTYGINQLAASDVEIDLANDHGIVVGTFKDSISLLGFKDTVHTAGRTDGYIIRFTSDAEPVWGYKLYADGGNTQIEHILTDPEGNMYVSGVYFGTAHYRGHVLPSKSTYPGAAHAFVMKISETGDYLWHHSELNGWAGRAIELVDHYVVFGFVAKHLPARIRKGVFTNTSLGEAHQIFAKVSTTNPDDIRYTQTPHKSATYWSAPLSAFSVDEKYHLFYVPKITIDTVAKKTWMSIACYNKNAVFKWEKVIGYTTEIGKNKFFISGTGVNEKRKIFVTCSFGKDIVIQQGEDAPVRATYTSQGTKDILVMKLQPNGRYLTSRVLGDETFEVATHMTKVGDGRIGIGGCYNGSLTVDNVQLETIPTDKGVNSFFAWLETAEAPAYVPAEYVEDTTNIATARQSVEKPASANAQEDGKALLLYPNPVKDGILHIDYPFDSKTMYAIQIKDIQGHLLYAERRHGIKRGEVITIPVNNILPGVYTISIESDQEVIAEQLIIE